MPRIPVVDIFAGPGGLAEGFSSYVQGNGRRPFSLAVSVEKDAFAHQTLTLRAFLRQFDGEIPSDYWEAYAGRISLDQLFALHPAEFRNATREALHLEMGPATAGELRARVAQVLRNAEEFVLVGGPPCQAYSLIGRSRNKGNASYNPVEDVRQTLYVEYLQVLADHRPAVFVMENVKGLLSATLDSERLFERIRSDLEDPASALRREGRSTKPGKCRYRIHSLVDTGESLLGLEPRDFVVRTELFGVPQARHRVILLGVREDLSNRLPGVLRPASSTTVDQAVGDLPRLRSGLTDSEDSSDNWIRTLQRIGARRWFKCLPRDLRKSMEDWLAQLTPPRQGRGGAFVAFRARRESREIGGVSSHMSRAHITADLERYFFSASFAKMTGRSPGLSDFPTPLLPKHRSALNATGHFADRFRVQVSTRPSTTVTSHIAKDGHYYIHPDPTQCRSLTVREAARLQTFPDDYLFCGPRTAQFHQVGNAVPPLLARQIAEVVADIL